MKKSQINILLSIIRNLTKNGKRKTNYREVVTQLKELLHLKVSLEAFNGGKNRSKFLYPLYYLPTKIIESHGIIRYSGRGTFELLDKKVKSI